jgi:AraC-like DNA-binding protein
MQGAGKRATDRRVAERARAGRFSMATSDSQPAIATHVLKSVLERLRDWQFDTAGLLREAGLERVVLADPNGFVPLAAYVATLESAAHQSQDPRLGLKLATATGPEALGAMGFAFLNARSLADGLYGLQRYIRAIQDRTRQQVVARDGQVHLTYRIEDDRIAPRRQDAEFSIALVHNIMRIYGGRSYRPLEVHFEHEPAGAVKLYDEYFGCRVYFGQKCNLIAPGTEALRAISPTVNGALHRLLSDQLEHCLRSRGVLESSVARVRALLTDEMIESAVAAGDVARLLCVSVSTMNRRLAHEGVSFGELLACKRRELAERLLGCSQLPIAEIAARLGYGENATFTRSFHRWRGMSPSQFRRAKARILESAAT